MMRFLLTFLLLFLSFSTVCFAEEDGGYEYYEDDTQDSANGEGYETGDLVSDSDIPDSVSSDESADSDSISSESEILGSFGQQDNAVSDLYLKLLQDLSNVGLNLSTDDPDEILEDEESENVESVVFPVNEPLSVDSLTIDANDVVLYSNYSTYYGAIGSTYIEYARGFLPKLKPKEHYVLARVGQYDYIFAYGEELNYDGSRYFSGNDIVVIRWNTYNNGSYSFGNESSFSLNAGSYLVYSDLGSYYPSLADTSDITSRQILYLLVIASIVWTISVMYNVRKQRRIKVIENS